MKVGATYKICSLEPKNVVILYITVILVSKVILYRHKHNIKPKYAFMLFEEIQKYKWEVIS